ncbi:hypothetical protein ACFL4N_03825 [Thermodesulfobacteriota bacterium]
MPVEVIDFRKWKKNTLQGFLTLRMEPSGLEIRDVCLHEKAGKRWLSMPAKQYLKEGESTWVPYLKFADRERRDLFQEAALKAFDEYNPAQEGTPDDGIPY